MIKKTNTEKWKDAWFCDLKPNEKLLFMYLTENCNDIGVFEINYSLMVALTGLEKKSIKEAFVSIQRCFIPNKRDKNSKRKIWLRNYLKHQGCVPLDITNDEHVRIKMLIEEVIEDFNNPDEMVLILDNVKEPKKKTKASSNFVPPTIEIFLSYYLKRNPDEEDGKALYYHYKSVGWKVGNRPMKDWQSAINKCISNKKKDGQEKKGKNSRLGEMADASEKFLNSEE